MKRIKEYNYLHLYSVFIIVSCCIESSLQLVHGEFLSFSLPQYFTHKFERWKRDAEPKEKLYYNIIFNKRDHHIELWPNHGFIAPNLVTEKYRGDIPVSSRKLKRYGDELCHYVGRVKGDRRYPVALSLCHGLVGYMMTPLGQYFIEPIAEHQANEHGQHVHVVYQHNAAGTSGLHGGGTPSCEMRERWTDAWAEQLKRVAKRSDDSGDTSNLHSRHRYLELLVTVDTKFIDYHKSDNMETYILTIMNMVSNYYHDASTGNQIDVHVVRVIYLEKPDKHLDLEISPNAQETLDSFCAWAKSVNPKDIANPQHHDIAVLLTRYDLCSTNASDCNLMGLAFVATACDPDKSCAINEDSGLALGITVTHELGHVMGCGHDDGKDSTCVPQNTEGDYYIMSPFVHMQTTQWSTCSEKFITELFESQLGNCLNDEPQESLYKATNMPPGSVYEADYQCNIAFTGSVHCILEESKICEMLYCKKPGTETCLSRGEPPSDGTKCGENMWCFNTKCVEMGQRPAAVDGGWGDWGEWSECSRSCGGGVSISSRSCDSPVPANKGRYCIGERKQVKLCNTENCPHGKPSYRQQQCTEFDARPFRDQKHTWKAYFFPDKACELNCINEHNVYVTLSPRAKDGTSCKPGTKNKCIFGVCRNVGCDWVIDSKAVEDICGICNGDGTQCTMVERVFTEFGPGYQKMTKIPTGSRNIRVTESYASANTIAVSAEDEKTFYLNGDFTEESNGEKDFGGVPGVYDHPSIDKENLFIRGPLIRPIILYAVFYSQNNTGIEYSYAMPSHKEESNITHVYMWEYLEYGDCSVRCGPGLKTAVAECTEQTVGKVADLYCRNIPKPKWKTMECNVRPCKTEWRAREWGLCSGCAKHPGTRSRVIDCVRENPAAGKDPIVSENYLCKNKNKPATQEMCCTNMPCKMIRSTNEFEGRMAALWSQLNAIEERRRIQKQDETNNKVYKKKSLSNEKATRWKKYAKLENYNVHKYSVVPQLTRNRLNDENGPKCRKPVMVGKRNIEKKDPSPRAADSSKRIFVGDHVGPEGNKIIEVPEKMDHDRVQLSDAAFETEGDKVIDTLDFCNAKEFTGKEADKELKRLNSAKN